uniref:PCI domain-containing protein n=1 Tax=Fibrocapsa japonica TaxID=94617 RepID=A0A7S2V5A0_9STRA
MNFIEGQANSHPDLAEKYGKLGDLFTRKLWHQLTEEISAFVSVVSNSKEDSFLKLYRDFISTFESKLNQLKFAQILVSISKTLSDTTAGEGLLSEVLAANRERLGTEASLLLDMEVALFKIRQSSDLAGARALVESGREVLEGIVAAEDTVVHCTYFRAAAEYYQAVGPPEEFYKSGLMFLAYTPEGALEVDQARGLALALTLAALTGDGIFNFGEVLATPILKALEGTEDAWLGEMLKVFHRGDVDAFTKLVDEHRPAFDAQVALSSREDVVKEKMALLCLMNMVFERPSHQRNIKFEEIAQRTRLPLDQVEWLVMRAMSLGLIKGIMDGVDQELSVSWVQPRVLENAQLKHLGERLEKWQNVSNNALIFMEDQTPELFN